MINAIADVVEEERRMRAALELLGHSDWKMREPLDLEHQLARLRQGSESRLGTPDDPFVLLVRDGKTGRFQPMVRYYIEADEERCLVHVSGSLEFMCALEEISEETTMLARTSAVH